MNKIRSTEEDVGVAYADRDRRTCSNGSINCAIASSSASARAPGSSKAATCLGKITVKAK